MKRATLRTHRIIRAVCSLVIIASIFAAWRFVDFSLIFDNINAQGYDPSQELAEIVRNLRLTTRGERVFRGTRAELQDAEAFNNSCERSSEKLYLLGCYSHNQVFVYNIKDNDLPGIREATLAHELLHAIWSRMSSEEKEAIMPALDSVYEKNEDLRNHLKLYSKTEYYDELHSIVGSQISSSNMPDVLKKHYAKYFTDPGIPANYYHQYSDKLATIEKRLTELEELMKKKKEDIEERAAKYSIANEQLSQDVLSFNSRNSRGMMTPEEFDTERAQLVERQQAMKEEYDAITEMRNDYNMYVAEYNKYVAFTSKVYDSMNSQLDAPSD